MRQPCRATVAFLIWPADVPWARPMRCFAFRLEPYPIRDRPSRYQTRYTQSPHPTDLFCKMVDGGGAGGWGDRRRWAAPPVVLIPPSRHEIAQMSQFHTDTLSVSVQP